MKYLVFQHIECEHPGIFRDLMRADDVDWDTVELDQGGKIRNLEQYGALMVMGGPMDVWQREDHPWLIDEISVISEWVRSGKPFLGFCLGHQLLAQALDGEVAPAKYPEIGVLPVRLTDDGQVHWFFRDCPSQILSLQWHSAEITALPEGAKILAETNACRVNAMSWGDYAVSVQFHVEMTKDTVTEWGQVPAYANALETAMGIGALDKMNRDADSSMADFNRISSILYRNFSDRVKHFFAAGQGR